MIKRHYRFHGLGSLRFAYNGGQTVRSAAFSMRFRHNDRRKVFRCAVVVSKKVSKSAVVRNRIRRRVYAIVAGMAPKIEQPFDIVILVFSAEVATMPSGELTQVLKDLFSQAGVVS